MDEIPAVKEKKKRPTPAKIINLPSGIVSCADYQPAKVKWAWQGRVLAANLNLLEGWKGAGKSTVAANIAVALSKGLPMPGGKGKSPPGTCLWIGSEEDVDSVILPRWIAQGGDRSRLYVINKSTESKDGRLVMPGQCGRLRDMLSAIGANSIVVDPFSSLGGPSLDINSEQSCRGYLESIREASSSIGCTPILIRHLRKGKSGGGLEAGLGSVAISNVCRVVMRADKHPERPGDYLLSVIASNHGSVPMPIAYRMIDTPSHSPKLKWLAEEDYSLEEIIDGTASAGEGDESKDARTLLTKILAEGESSVKSILAEAKAAGIGERTMRSAKAKMRITSKRKAYGEDGEAQWYWALPKGE